MTYKSATGKTIEQAFQEFDINNPQIWKEFERRGLYGVNQGKASMSSKRIITMMREQEDITTDTPDQYKINDVFTCMYGRKFNKKYMPKGETFFRERKRRTQEPDYKPGEQQSIMF